MEPSPQEPRDAIAELMRREGAALRALARGLLGAGDGAEDVVQDAALVALRGAPSERLGAWLRGVVRNLARMARRGERRRARRELAGAGAAEAPSAADIAASSELMQRVAAAVHALDEPFRTVVVLRFFHDHEPAEIARGLGVPVNTVRSRLQRALARLRERLDGECGGRQAWAAPLLALLGGASLAAPAAAASIGVLVASGVTMKKVVVAGVGLLVLGLGIAALAGGGLAPWRSGGDAPAAAEAGTGGEAKPLAAAADSRATVRTALPADATGWVVRGTVLDMDRNLLPRLRLAAERFLGYETTGAPREREELVSDGGGRIEWRLEPPQGTVTLRFLCRQEGYRDWSSTGTARIVVRGEAPPQDLVLTVSALDATVRGRVTGRKGERLLGAWVQGPLGRESERCGADGEFVLRTIQGWGLAGAPGRVAQPFQITRPPQGQDAPTVEIRLREGLPLGGSVLDTEGQPVAGAAIEVRGPMPGGTVSSDSAGRYELTCIDPDASTALVVRHPEFLPAVAYVKKDAATMDVVLHRGAVIEGRVLGPGDVPVAGARVCIDEHMVEATEAVTRDDGQFVLRHVAKGERVLAARASELGGRARGIAADYCTIVVPEDGRLAGILVRLAAGRSIAGKVVDEAGAGVAGVGVGAEEFPRDHGPASRPARQSPSGLGLAYAQTDASGRFRLEDLPARRLLLRAAVRPGCGYLDGSLEVPATSPGDGAIITLASAGGYAGTVVDARTKKPIERFKVRVFANHEGTPRFDEGNETADARGEWRIEGKYPELETHWVQAWAKGYRPTPRRKVEYSAKPDPGRLILELEPAAAIAGRVLDSAGLPVVDAKVIPHDERLARDPQRQAELDELARHSTISGADGRFAIDGLPGGELALRVRTRGRPAWADGPFQLRVGEIAERMIVLGDGTSVRGRLLDVRGAPVAGAAVVLEGVEVPSGYSEPQQAQTGADGTFAFGQRCAEGRFRAQALVEGVDGALVLCAAVVIATGDTAELEVRPAGACSLVASLTGVEPMPPRATVWVTFNSTELGIVHLQAEAMDGVLRLAGLPRAQIELYSSLPEAPRGEQWYGSTSCATAPDRSAEATITLRRKR